MFSRKETDYNFIADNTVLTTQNCVHMQVDTLWYFEPQLEISLPCRRNLCKDLRQIDCNDTEIGMGFRGEAQSTKVCPIKKLSILEKHVSDSCSMG